jgi:hypothetical protein
MGETHYIGMAGLYGYMPNYLTAGETKQDVADDLGLLHEDSDDLGPGIDRNEMARELMEAGHVTLPYGAGNEYAEISECDGFLCPGADAHNDY